MKTHIVFAIMAGLLLALLISQTRNKTLTFENVIQQAESLSKEPYKEVRDVSSKVLRELNYDQFRDIRWKDEYTLWRRLGLPFQAKFLLTGHIHSKPVTLFQVNREAPGQLRFAPEFFDFGKNRIESGEIEKGGYSGFRLHYPIKRPDYLDEFLVFHGASYFRSVGKDQVYGLSARALTIGLTKKEEFPQFTTFWLVEPQPGATEMKVYALLDGKSVTGAYEFRIVPGEATRIDIRAVLFPRRDIADVGIAPLTSMFWFGENTSNTFGDYRPEVHDSDGLQIEMENGEWVWRPLSWSKQLQVSVFDSDSPRGFGLMQRDREFAHYQDMEARYQMRPCAWVRPSGNWGKGKLHLVQLPTNNEFMDNVVAYWQPERGVRKGERFEIAYSTSWFGENSAIPPLGRCLFTRIDYQDASYYRMFVLDFGGGELAKLPAEAHVSAQTWISETGGIRDVQVQKNNYNDSWRVTFIASSNQLNKPVEMRCLLAVDGKPVTETWTYTWRN